ncbi:MAG TPA: HlyD family efflux transporter periplasmic adaptor subunit [Bacteroidales bacterium]|nr:HlyD family efflux transporter periplasmic adaptor subunit [Bacteroidales bacterium]
MKYTYVTSALFLFVLALVSCNNQEKEPFAYGNFESEDVLVSAEVTGTVERLMIDEGDMVKSGQLIGIIDTSQLHLKKEQVRASGEAIRSKLSQIDKQINVNNVNIKNVKRDLDRIRAMHKDGAATDKQLDDMEGKVDLLEARDASMQSQKTSVYAELSANRAQLDQVQDQLDKCLLRAPMDGTILETYVRQGELAAAGRALYKVADMSTIILRAFIDGDQLSSIKTGDNVTVNFDGPDGTLLSKQGTVTWIASEAEFTPKIIQTRKERVNLVYAVKVKVPDDGSLKIGMPGEIASLNTAE